MNESESFDALWEYCTRNDRAVPNPQRWNQLFGMLRDKRQLATGGWQASLPLILAARHHTMPAGKQLRFREHIEWVRDHDQVDEIGQYLRSLPERDWCHFGEL